MKDARPLDRATLPFRGTMASSAGVEAIEPCAPYRDGVAGPRQSSREKKYMPEVLDSADGHHDQVSKIKQVVVPWTSKRPSLSVTRPSAVPTRRPRLINLPSAFIEPVSGVIGRTNDILNSSVVEPTPFSNVEWIASPCNCPAW